VPRAVCWSRCERRGLHLSVSRVGVGVGVGVGVAAVVFLFLKGARQENVAKGGLCSRERVERSGTVCHWTVMKIK
jgi:hypothetical protein